MEVRLTPKQVESLGARYAFDDRLAGAFVVPRQRRYIEVVLPAIGWLKIRDDLARVCFTARGFRNSKIPVVDSGALRRIQKQLNLLHVHPALRGYGLEGRWGTVIPVWGAGGERFSEFPVTGGEFTLLVPKWDVVSRIEVTTWHPGPAPIDDPLLNEATHLAFGYAE